MIFGKIISASLSPNTQRDDVLVALRMLVSPRRWVMGPARLSAEKWFAKFLGNTTVCTFNSGRSALFVLLRAFGIGVGDDVLIQAFTCVAVPGSVIWAGAKPVYVDIDATLNMDPVALAKKITPKTKAIIVQHTMGIPADMDAIIAIARTHSLLVIEDCAHSVGATLGGKKLGTLGDGAIFSFGRDKVISSIFGGLAVVSPKHEQAAKRLKELHDNLPYPTGFWILQQILHPIAFALILPWYRLGPGKLALWLLQKLRILGYPIYPEEKSGHRPSVFPRKYPNALAAILLNQLKKFDMFAKRRSQAVEIYERELGKSDGVILIPSRPGASYLRYPILVDKPSVRFARAKSRGILLGNWYHNVIDPKGVSLSSVFYKRKSCPTAEGVATRILNLPTLVSTKVALRIAKEIIS